MTDVMYIRAVTADGAAEKAAEIAADISAPLCRTRISAYFPPSETDGEVTAVGLRRGDETVLPDCEVPPQGEGLIGAYAEVCVGATLDGCAPGGTEMLASLSAFGGFGDVGLDCVTADGTRSALSPAAVTEDGGATLSAQLPDGAALAVVTLGEDCIALPLKATAEESETVSFARGVALTESVCRASAEGVRSKEFPVTVADVKTYPDMPPAERLASFGNVLVACGYGLISAYVGGNTATFRAAENVGAFAAADDGTLAYASGGLVKVCRGGEDLFTVPAEADGIALLGEGGGLTVHILSGGGATGYGADGAQLYSRETDALCLATFGGAVFEIAPERARLYSADGTKLHDAQTVYPVTGVLSASDGYAVVTVTAPGGSEAVSVLTPFLQSAFGASAAGCDGALIADYDGGLRLYDARSVPAREICALGSAVFAFAGALYEAGADGRITRREALRAATLLTIAEETGGAEAAGTAQTSPARAAEIKLTTEVK